MKVYGLKTCDTCRKAVKALQAAGQTVEMVDVRAAPLERDQIEAFLAAFGEALVNRKSTTWRQLSEYARAQAPAALLAAHPALMKRPVIVDGDAVYLGWGKEVQNSLLG
ncbi:MAG: ArsC/Spx/MgsR family protein [Paracoccaceae bacterium]|nr:ArsC/Spx/MgsR family protein [Paracoccaceae bacterium]